MAMHVQCEKSLDHDSSKTGARCAEILTALGHGPSFKLEADKVDNVVHGSVSIAFCDTRILDEEIIKFSDGHEELITADNVARYFADQGHRLVSIVGNQAFGNTIIDVEVYEADEPAGFRFVAGRRVGHERYFKCPDPMPTVASLRSRLDAWTP